MTQVVYSASRVRGIGKQRGLRFVNPRFFIAPEPGVRVVYLNGDYPAIRAAYEQAGVPVHALADRPQLTARLPAPRRPRRRRKAAE